MRYRDCRMRDRDLPLCPTFARKLQSASTGRVRKDAASALPHHDFLNSLDSTSYSARTQEIITENIEFSSRAKYTVM